MLRRRTYLYILSYTKKAQQGCLDKKKFSGQAFSDLSHTENIESEDKK